jgi:hypothetical protein
MCSCGNGHLDEECRTEAAAASRALASERRSFLKTMAATAGGAAALGTTLVTPRTAEAAVSQGKLNHYYVPATDQTVHWGYFSKALKPVVEVDSGDFVTIEALTHHANDDAERMVKGDPGAESVYFWGCRASPMARAGTCLPTSSASRGMAQATGQRLP